MRSRRPLTRLIFLAVIAAFLFYHFQPLGGLPGHFSRPLEKLKPASSNEPIEFVPTSYDWSGFQQHHPRLPSDVVRLPPASARKELPRVQHDFSKDGLDKEREIQDARRDTIRKAFKKSWDSYAEYAWGSDELAPLTGERKNPYGGYGTTLVDALDALWIMELKSDFVDAAREASRLDFAATEATSLNLFETTIRILGGLLSAHDLSGESALLRKAVELGDMLYTAFDTPNRIPGFMLDLARARDGGQVGGQSDPSAAPTSLGLEFTRLAQLTGDAKYYDAVDAVYAMLERAQNHTLLPGMWPALMNFRDGAGAGSPVQQSHHDFTIGALAGSLYEYLLKMHALLAGAEPRFERMYRAAAAVIEQNLLFRPMIPPAKAKGDSRSGESEEAEEPNVPDVLFAGTAVTGGDGTVFNNNEGQHLACFAGGMFGLGGRLLGAPAHVDIGERLARGCAWGYSSFSTGLLPEIFGLSACPSISEPCRWDEQRWREEMKSREEAEHHDRNQPELPPGFTHARDLRYTLRPEAIESLFVMYRITGKKEMRELAWQMFLDIQAATSTPLANAAIEDVTVAGETKKVDSMESFWLSETLKYFYLIFSDPGLVSLDEWVFNTEAHPLKLPAKATETELV